MLDKNYRPPYGTKIGKAKALEVIILFDGTRMPKKSKVKYWVERQGAREEYFIIYLEKAYKLTHLEFKRHFKMIIRGGEVRHKLPA